MAKTVSTIELITIALNIGKQLATIVVIASLMVFSCLIDLRGVKSLRALMDRRPLIILFSVPYSRTRSYRCRITKVKSTIFSGFPQ